MEETRKNVLLVDDDEDYYVLTKVYLSDSETYRFEGEWEQDWDKALSLMKGSSHDVYLVDYNMGERNGLDLLRAAVEGGCRAPIIMMTGQGDRELDLAAMKAGAADYLNKKNLSSELIERSIRYSIERKQAEMEREKLIAELKKALDQVKTLSGMIPICASCKKVRNDGGYWQQVEDYLSKHSNVDFTHSLCPDCVKKLYPNLSDRILGDTKQK